VPVVTVFGLWDACSCSTYLNGAAPEVCPTRVIPGTHRSGRRPKPEERSYRGRTPVCPLEKYIGIWPRLQPVVVASPGHWYLDTPSALHAVAGPGDVLIFRCVCCLIAHIDAHSPARNPIPYWCPTLTSHATLWAAVTFGTPVETTSLRIPHGCVWRPPTHIERSHRSSTREHPSAGLAANASASR
jgi:hypothetical protein